MLDLCVTTCRKVCAQSSREIASRMTSNKDGREVPSPFSNDFPNPSKVDYVKVDSVEDYSQVDTLQIRQLLRENERFRSLRKKSANKNKISKF